MAHRQTILKISCNNLFIIIFLMNSLMKTKIIKISSINEHHKLLIILYCVEVLTSHFIDGMLIVFLQAKSKTNNLAQPTTRVIFVCKYRMQINIQFASPPICWSLCCKQLALTINMMWHFIQLATSFHYIIVHFQGSFGRKINPGGIGWIYSITSHLGNNSSPFPLNTSGKN